MKKQIGPPIKEHFLRALILLSLVIFSQDIFCQTPTPTATATPTPTASVCPRPTPGTCVSYEAESVPPNTLTGSAFVLSCPACSGGFRVGYVGNNSGTLTFLIGNVVPGRQTVTIFYTNGDPVRYALLSVNGGQGMPLTFPSTGSFQTVGWIQATVVLNTGCNTLEFYNPIVGSWTPDFDQISFNCPTHPAFFNGEIGLGGGWYYLQFPNGTPFGYYSYLPDQNFIYHIDLGFEYLFDGQGGGISFYDFASSSFFYTSPSSFPFLYDFSLNAWLYYLPDGSSPGRYSHNPRWFYNFATGQWITL